MASSVHRNRQPEAFRPYVNEDAFLKICSCAKYTKTYDSRTVKSDPIVKTYGSKTIGFYARIGHRSGYG